MGQFGMWSEGESERELKPGHCGFPRLRSAGQSPGTNPGGFNDPIPRNSFNNLSILLDFLVESTSLYLQSL